MTDFQIGEKARIKYWDELPNRPGWSENFFKMYSGERVKVCGKVGEYAFDVYTEESGDYLTVGHNTLKKDLRVPDELFEI